MSVDTQPDAISRSASWLDSETLLMIRRIILGLASREDNAAATEAALVPYWKACPATVIGHRAAASALRAAADALDVAVS